MQPTTKKENEVRMILKNLMASTPNNKKYQYEKTVQMIMTLITNKVDLGQLRRFIRKERNTVSTLKFIGINNDDKKAYNRIPQNTDASRNKYEVYQQILSASKRVMNGDNVIMNRKCAYVDREERNKEGIPYHCMEPSGDFVLCKTHHEFKST